MGKWFYCVYCKAILDSHDQVLHKMPNSEPGRCGRLADGKIVSTGPKVEVLTALDMGPRSFTC